MRCGGVGAEAVGMVRCGLVGCGVSVHHLVLLAQLLFADAVLCPGQLVQVQALRVGAGRAPHKEGAVLGGAVGAAQVAALLHSAVERGDGRRRTARRLIRDVGGVHRAPLTSPSLASGDRGFDDFAESAEPLPLLQHLLVRQVALQAHDVDEVALDDAHVSEVE